tara:strand:+ start:19839 stop:21359 length:1521 start_codon:yes stop_codon:yes gene_type:complete
MGIKRYFATQDNTISNAFKSDLRNRGTGSNMGASDVLEAFVIHGQTSASIDSVNAEQSRILLQFDMNQVLDDIANGVIPSSSVDFHLRMFNAPHADTTPLSYSLDVIMLTQSWEEGRGLDMDAYSDIGVCNWLSASKGTFWGADPADPATRVTGGYFETGENASASYFFSGGVEDLDVNVNFAVDRWRSSGSAFNNGFILKHTDDVIAGSKGTFFTKKFFGRTSEFYFKRPVLEARWDSSRKDNRGNFIVSSSLADGSDNLNTLFLYNNVRGQLKNIPGLIDNQLLLRVYSGSATAPGTQSVLIIDSDNNARHQLTGGILIENGVEISGVYTCSFATTSSNDYLYDVWHTASGGGTTEFFTGSFEPTTLKALELIYEDEYITDITNLKSSYIQGQKPRLRVFPRRKNWNPNIFTVATAEVVPEIIEDAYFRIHREVDNMEIISFGTGSLVNDFTRMSYDVSGSYFQVDTSFLEPGFTYKIQFVYYLQGEYRQQPEVFKFRVEEPAP